MKIPKTKEIIIEFERVQIVRRRSRTDLMTCDECRKGTDFISLTKAASLFSIGPESLFQFITTTRSHYHRDAGGEIFICVHSLLDSLNKKTNSSGKKLNYQVKMIGD